MLKYLINNPSKWSSLELYKYIQGFGFSFDKQILDYLNAPSTEAGFLLTLSPTEREIYKRLEAQSFNDDNELMDNVFLFAEGIMRKQTSELLAGAISEIDNIDIFETLEGLAEKSNKILESAAIEEDNFFDDWEQELRKKVAGDLLLIESSIIKNVPFIAGELTILAARPSMGKTAMALSLLLEKSKDFKTLFISSEMPVKRIIDRLVSYATGIDTRRITTGRLQSYELNLVLEAKNELEKNDNIELAYCENIRKVKRVISNSSSRLVMVDYLQLIKSDIKAERRLQIAEMSRDFKRLSVAKNVPLILLAQINRATLQSENKRPGLENLAESAAIEQDADNVIFIHRPPYYLAEEFKKEMSAEELSETELIIAKQRDGLRGVGNCQFIKGRFYPMNEQPKEQTLELDDFVPF